MKILKYICFVLAIACNVDLAYSDDLGSMKALYSGSPGDNPPCQRHSDCEDKYSLPKDWYCNVHLEYLISSEIIHSTD